MANTATNEHLPHPFREHRDRIETLMMRVQQSRDARKALMRDPERVLSSWGIEFPEDSRPIQVVDLAEVNLLALPPLDPPSIPVHTQCSDGDIVFVRRWWGIELLIEPNAVAYLTETQTSAVISELVQHSGGQAMPAALFGAFLSAERSHVRQCSSDNGVVLRATWLHVTAGLWWLVTVSPQRVN